MKIKFYFEILSGRLPAESTLAFKQTFTKVMRLQLKSKVTFRSPQTNKQSLCLDKK